MMRRTCAYLVAASLGVWLAGCARVNDTGQLLLASKTDALAVVNGVLLQGSLQMYGDRTGTLNLRSGEAPEVAADAATPNPVPAAMTSCVGQLRYTSTSGGSIDLRCNESLRAELRFALRSELRGHAYGASASGPVSLVFGLTAQEAMAYLTAPVGKVLRERKGTLFLEAL